MRLRIVLVFNIASPDKIEIPMSAEVFKVRVGQVVFEPKEQLRTNGKWMQALSMAHRQDVTHCLCNGATPVVVKLYGKDTPSSYYDLARWQDTGLNHDVNCRFFGENTKDLNGPDDTKPAIYELDDNKIRVHLSVSLSQAEPRNIDSQTPSSPSSGKRSTRARAQEVTVLMRLWREARLNTYFGKSRGWFKASYLILKNAERMIIDKKGASLADVLLVGTHDDDKMTMESNLAALTKAMSNKSRLFVVGRLRKPDWSKPKQLLPLLDFKGLPKVMIETNILEKFMKDRPFLHNIVEDKSGNLIVFACIESTGGEWWKAVTLTGMPVSKNMTPLDSGYELEFEQYLVDQERKFLKPMINAELESSDQRPDFILMDTNPRIRIEVWGMQTDEYRQGKALRMAEYARKGQTLLSWSANPRESLPVLPPKQ